MFVLSKNNLYLGFPPTEIGHPVTGEISDLVVRRYFCIDLAIVGQTSSATSDAAILLDAWRWTNENASSTAASSLDLRFLIRLSFSTLNQFSVSGESISRKYLIIISVILSGISSSRSRSQNCFFIIFWILWLSIDRINFVTLIHISKTGF